LLENVGISERSLMRKDHADNDPHQSGAYIASDSDRSASLQENLPAAAAVSDERSKQNEGIRHQIFLDTPALFPAAPVGSWS
jgi:hypothetical protein